MHLYFIRHKGDIHKPICGLLINENIANRRRVPGIRSCAREKVVCPGEGRTALSTTFYRTHKVQQKVVNNKMAPLKTFYIFVARITPKTCFPFPCGI